MSDTARGVALLLSVLLWSPVAPGLLRGQVAAEKALLLYVAALVLTLIGCSLLSSLLRAYTPEPVADAADGSSGEAEQRRAAERRAQEVADDERPAVA